MIQKKFVISNNIIQDSLSTYNIPEELYNIKENGKGAGEYSIVSLLTGIKDKNTLNIFLAGSNYKYDICIDDKLFEVKTIKTKKSKVRANSHSRIVINTVTKMLNSIYSRLEFIFNNANDITIELFNKELSVSLNSSINIIELINRAQEKIRNENYTRIFLGLDKDYKTNKVNLVDLIANIEQIAQKYLCNESKIVSDVRKLTNILQNSTEYNVDALEGCLKFALLKSLKTANFDINDISSLIYDINLSGFVNRMHNYIQNDAIDQLLQGKYGIFFIIANSQKEFIYIPNNLYKDYIEFAGVSQSVNIQLKKA